MSDNVISKGIFSKSHKSTKKWLVILIAGLILLGIITFVVYLGINNNKSTTDNTVETKAQKAENDRDSKAVNYIANNNPTAAVKLYKDDIKSYTSNSQKADVYIEMAAILYDYDAAKYKDQILQYAYEAERLAPSAKTATFIMDIEAGYGNKSATAKYKAMVADRTKNYKFVGN